MAAIIAEKVRGCPNSLQREIDNPIILGRAMLDPKFVKYIFL
jgi:hypothetical protein